MTSPESAATSDDPDRGGDGALPDGLLPPASLRGGGPPDTVLPGREAETGATSSRRISPRRIGQSVLGLALAVVLLVWGLPHFAETTWHDVFAVLAGVPPARTLAFLALELAGLWCYTFTLTGSLPGLSHTRALVVNVCGSSVSNLLPGGGAVGLAATFAICRSWGFSRRAVSTSAIVTGVWNTLARVALPVIALATLYLGATGLPPLMRDAAVTGALGGLVLLALFVAMIASDRVAQGIGRAVDRTLRPLLRRRQRTTSVDELMIDLRHRINGVVQAAWVRMTLGMVGFFGVYYVLFVVIMRTTGVSLGVGELFAAFAIGRLLTAVGVTPGGVGITETGTAAALVAWGADPAAATAGIVLFSIFTHLMELPLGAIGWLAWSLMPRPVGPHRSGAG